MVSCCYSVWVRLVHPFFTYMYLGDDVEIPAIVGIDLIADYY